ncbi:MAG: hypothetical protein J7L94_14850, partial [Caldisericaceae bacterium]|nr:hypothetical protein [Caldisericaceae bacterium]
KSFSFQCSTIRAFSSTEIVELKFQNYEKNKRCEKIACRSRPQINWIVKKITELVAFCKIDSFVARYLYLKKERKNRYNQS